MTLTRHSLSNNNRENTLTKIKSERNYMSIYILSSYRVALSFVFIVKTFLDVFLNFLFFPPLVQFLVCPH